MRNAVRPTRRCLADLDLPVPNLGVRLCDLEHPLVVKSQQVPDEVASGNAERVRSLTDRVWFKIKTGQWRGAATDLRDVVPADAPTLGARWWLGAAGTRQEDSPQHDFYALVADAAHRGGTHSCSTDYLLPSDWDLKRLAAEAAVNAQAVLERLVRTAAAESLLNSDIREFKVGDRDVRVRIKVLDDGQAYVAIGATGSLDATLFVALVSAIPGVPPSDWLPEPGGGLDLEPAPGEVLWSAMLSADAQTELLGLGDVN